MFSPSLIKRYLVNINTQFSLACGRGVLGFASTLLVAIARRMRQNLAREID
jgi:hypothetical protein